MRHLYLALSLAAVAVAQTPYAKLVGVEVGGDFMFVDVAKTLRPWTPVNDAKEVPTDGNFWPRSDCQSVMYDTRPVAEWAGTAEVDDPAAYRPDMGGTYKLSLTGQAAIQASGGQVVNQLYNPDTNTTTADILVPFGRESGKGLLILTFRDTRRTPEADSNTGFTNLALIRPGYDANTDQVFTNEFLASLKPFSVLRFMGLLDTNASNSRNYGRPVAEMSMNWSDRHLPADATQQHYGPSGYKHGLAWEYIVQIVNLTGKDLWVNTPVSASDDYIRRLAQFLKDNLRPGAIVYLEHSNEVWNFSFPQYTWNKVAAQQEVAAGGSSLNNDGTRDPEVWARRRHARRLLEIGRTFAGAGLNVRPVYASWNLYPDAYYASILDWVNTTYGAPGTYFYGIAKDGYFGYDKGVVEENVDSILSKFRNASDDTRTSVEAFKAVADRFGLKLLVYEGGPGYQIGNRTNIGNRIAAARDGRMREIVSHHIVDNWLALGGDLFMYFAQSGKVSRYGQWGAMEDITNAEKVLSPKLLGILDVTEGLPPLTGGVKQKLLQTLSDNGAVEPLTCDQWNYYFEAAAGVRGPDITLGCYISDREGETLTLDQYWKWLEGV